MLIYKEGLKSVTNNNNSQEFLTQYKNKKNEKVSLENRISNLNSRVDYYKKFYWLNLIPVLGWIGCVVFYFSKLRSIENELNMLQRQLRNAESAIFDMGSRGCENIEAFINSGDDYNKDKQNSISEIVKNKEEDSLSDNISNNQPQLDKQGSVK